ncbi:MAG: hypothetical protein ABI354_01830 [Candidatus Saccharimonadales bacterium]
MGEAISGYTNPDFDTMLEQLRVGRSLREVASTHEVEYDSDRAWEKWGALRPAVEISKLTIMAPTATELVMHASVENPSI